MNPKKNKLWIKMIKISRKKYSINKLDFNRIKDGKFVEDKEELEKIGKELFDNFGLEKLKIKMFIDICAAPGFYSNIIMKTVESRGIGISLPPEKGGVEFIDLGPKYKTFYKDILEKNYKVVIPKKVDFGLASCVSYVDDKKLSSILNLKLILVSLDLILNVLKKNGNLIINLTMKNIYFAFNIINILSKYFKKYNLWKSDKIWETKNTFYFFGYDFNDNYDDEINKLKNFLNNKNSEVFTRFKGKYNEFKNINLKMNDIYKVRIKSFKKML